MGILRGSRQYQGYFGCVLREFRKQRAISQENLAFEAGLDRSYISKLETGVYQPSMTTLFAIAEVLQIDPSEIVKRVYEGYVSKREVG